MLRIKVTIQAEYVNISPINHKARINMGKFIPSIFAKINPQRHSPMSKNTLRIVVKMISECE
jgi:hypothetical protein